MSTLHDLDMSHEPAPYTTPPPVASPVAPEAGAALSEARLAELKHTVDEERTDWNGRPFDKLGFWPAAVEELLNHAAALRTQLAEANQQLGLLKIHSEHVETLLASCEGALEARNAQLAEAEEARKAEVAGLTAKLAREGEQEAELLKRDEQLRQLRSAIEKASAPHLSAEEREAYASNTNGQGTRGAFGAGQLMGRVALAQDLLALLAPKLPAAGIQEPAPWCARCPATEAEVNAPGFRCAMCEAEGMCAPAGIQEKGGANG